MRTSLSFGMSFPGVLSRFGGAPKLSERMGRGGSSGFDYLRLGLALAVVTWHTLPLTAGQGAAAAFMDGPLGPFISLILPMFFALSGFLVAASLDRNTLRVFLGFRALRILPALAVEIGLSALVLGPLVSSASWREYFTSGQFFLYFGNVFGWIHYKLPGVFLNNPYPGVVNGSLWTVPHELECYVALTLLFVLRIWKSPVMLLVSIVLGGLFILLLAHFHGAAETLIDPGVLGRSLILCFLAGVFFYAARDRVPHSWVLALAAAAIGFGLMRVPELYILAPMPCAYLTVWIGLHRIPKLPVIFSGDYSYGMYLYAFPIQQTLIWAFPGLRQFALLLPVSIVCIFAFAVFSWIFIEKPTLRLKRWFSASASNLALHKLHVGASVRDLA